MYAKQGHQNLPPFPLNEKLNDPTLYIPSDALVDAVNVALTLGQPLLLTGEPGTGKTQLAEHLAQFFDLGDPLVFNAQTTSVANDLFYRYDALGHFQYNQNNPGHLTTIAEIEEKFIHYEALGDAIKNQKRCVVLIDEIDKAPRDLPNDILFAIERLSFKVPEIGKRYTSSPALKPVIILTSNSEKNLPDAFLRRVIYYHIPFPDKEALLEILNKKMDGFSDPDLTAIITHFNNIRNSKSTLLKKKPATAELIYWTLLLQKTGFPVSKINDPKSLTPPKKTNSEPATPY